MKKTKLFLSFTGVILAAVTLIISILTFNRDDTVNDFYSIKPTLYNPNSINLKVSSQNSDYKVHIYNVEEKSENVLLSLNKSIRKFVTNLNLTDLTTRHVLIFEPEGDFVFGSGVFNGYSGFDKELSFKK